MSLVDRLKAARLSKYQAGGFEFSLRRPTAFEMLRLAEKQKGDTGFSLHDIAPFVSDWNLTELDLGIPGGTGDKAPFDTELFELWLEDQPELWGGFIDQLVSLFNEHGKALGDAEKKPDAG